MAEKMLFVVINSVSKLEGAWKVKLFTLMWMVSNMD